MALLIHAPIWTTDMTSTYVLEFEFGIRAVSIDFYSRWCSLYSQVCYGVSGRQSWTMTRVRADQCRPCVIGDDYMVPSKQRLALGSSFYLCPYFCFCWRNEEECVCSEALLRLLGKYSTCFIRCLFNVSNAYPTSMLKWPLVGGMSRVQSALFVFEKARSADVKVYFWWSAVSGWLF